MSAEVRKNLKRYGIPAAAGFLYLVYLRTGGRGIPCLFRLLTGWKCPGCGVTRMLLSLSRLDFREAFRANPFVLCTLPLVLFEVLYDRYLRRSGKGMPRWNMVLLCTYAAALAVFGVLRNLSV